MVGRPICRPTHLQADPFAGLLWQLGNVLWQLGNVLWHLGTVLWQLGTLNYLKSRELLPKTNIVFQIRCPEECI